MSEATENRVGTGSGPVNTRYYCHDCRAEVEAILVPDPLCPRCHGSFVEEITPESDPSDLYEDGGADGIFAGLAGGREPVLLRFAGPGGSGGVVLQAGGAREGQQREDAGPPPVNPLSAIMQALGLLPPAGRGDAFAEGGAARANGGGPAPASGPGAEVRSGHRDGQVPIQNLASFLGEAFGPPHAADHPQNNPFAEGGYEEPEPYREPEHGRQGMPGTPMDYLMTLLQSIGGGQGQVLFGGPGGGARNLGDFAWGEAGFNQILQDLMDQNSFRSYRELSDAESIKDCPICREDYVVDEDLLCLPCPHALHAFHPECIKTWLKTSGTCPVCRFSLVPQPGEADPAEPTLAPPTGPGTGQQGSEMPGSFPGQVGALVPLDRPLSHSTASSTFLLRNPVIRSVNELRPPLAGRVKPTNRSRGKPCSSDLSEPTTTSFRANFPATPDRKHHLHEDSGMDSSPGVSSGNEFGTAKAQRTRSSTVGGRNASWSAPGRAFQDDLPAVYQHNRGAGRSELPAQLNSSTSSRYAASTSSAPGSGRSAGRTSSGGLPYSSFARGTSPGGRSNTGRFSLAPPPAAGSGASQFLLTVVPPMHLPHDPPHPRTSTACSGYGPPENFRRGTLIPLYPTLSSQLGAIAREYGLPSTGGLVLYLLSTSDPSSSTPAALPGSQGLTGEGGPRIGDEAWRLLWGRLLQAEDDESQLLAGNADSLSDEDDYAPPVPPIPRSHLASLSHHHSLHDNGVQSADPRYPGSMADMQSGPPFTSDSDVELEIEPQTSFSCDEDGAESVYSTAGNDMGDTNTTASTKSRQGSSSTGPGSDRRPSSGGLANIGRGHPSIQSGLPSPVSRNASASATRRGLPSFPSQPNLRHSSHQSILSNPPRSSSRSILYPTPPRPVSYGSFAAQPLGGAGYGASVIVGKVEFDIDYRRGNSSRWYNDWVVGATPPPSLPTSASHSNGASSAPRAADFVDESKAARSYPLVPMISPIGDEFSPPPFPKELPQILPHALGLEVAHPSAHQPLLLPTLVGRRQSEEKEEAPPAPVFQEHSPPSEPELDHGSPSEDTLAEENDDLVPAVIAAFPPTPLDGVVSMRLRTASGRSRAVESTASGYSIAAVADNHGGDNDQPFSRRQTHSPSPASGGMTASSSLSSIKVYEDDFEVEDDDDVDESFGYAPLEGQDDYVSLTSHEHNGDSDSAASEYGDIQNHHTEDKADDSSLTPSLSRAAEDPLADIFPDDEATWQTMADELNEMKSPPREPTSHSARDLTDATSLGPHVARIKSLSQASAPGIVERGLDDESLSPDGHLPPQDDVEDIRTLLTSGQAQDKWDAVNLASPINLDPASASDTGVFPDNAASEADAIDSRIPPPLVLSDSTNGARRRNRHGGSDWSAAASPTQEAMPNFTLLPHSLGTPGGQRDSTMGLMENLDDLERALAELSPKTSKTVQSDSHSSPLTPIKSKDTQEVRSLEEAVMEATMAEPPISLASAAEISPRTSRTDSSRTDSRPIAYLDLIDTPPPSATAPFRPVEVHQTLMERRPSAPDRKLSITSEIDGYAKESQLESSAPGTPVPSLSPVVRQDRRTSSPVPRTPRTSSLSRADERTPRNVPLPPSPLPPSPMLVQSHEPVPPLPVSLSQEGGPAGLGIDFPSLPSTVQSLPADALPPPVPSKKPSPLDLAYTTLPNLPSPVQSPASPSMPPPRSPSLRSLRPSNPWKSSDKGDKSPESGEKSPLGAFFQKPAFKFFSKKNDGSSSPTISPVDTAEDLRQGGPPSPLGGSQASAREEALHLAADAQAFEAAPTFPLVASLGRPTHQLRPAPSTDSFRTASPGPSTEDGHVSNFAPPPHPSSPGPDRSIIISSPRSEYGAPGTPIVGSTRYPASAPATPAGWSPRAGDGFTSRFGRSKPKPKISSDIDDLLLQMSDFGTDDADVAPLPPMPSPGLALPDKRFETPRRESSDSVARSPADRDAGESLGNHFLMS
ncbi:hypothetical protein P7C70_g3490, partial [Phenoliferia sp. Uapishka_3]